MTKEIYKECFSKEGIERCETFLSGSCVLGDDQESNHFKKVLKFAFHPALGNSLRHTVLPQTIPSNYLVSDIAVTELTAQQLKTNKSAIMDTVQAVARSLNKPAERDSEFFVKNYENYLASDSRRIIEQHHALMLITLARTYQYLFNECHRGETRKVIEILTGIGCATSDVAETIAEVEKALQEALSYKHFTATGEITNFYVKLMYNRTFNFVFPHTAQKATLFQRAAKPAFSPMLTASIKNQNANLSDFRIYL